MSRLPSHKLAKLDMVAMRLYRLGETPNYEPPIGSCLAAEALQKKDSVLSVLYDALLEQEGRALLYFPLMNYTGMNLDAVHEMLSHPLALPGLSDGGAHVGTVCDSSFPTFFLMHWGRDRERGRIPLETIIKRLCHDTSSFIGLRDRGLLEVGRRADINVIDIEKLGLAHPEMHDDLPAPVAPAMSKCGMVARLTRIDLPLMSRPTATSSGFRVATRARPISRAILVESWVGTTPRMS